MSSNTKIILGIVVGLLVILCLCACATASIAGWFFRNSSVNVSPSRIATAADAAIQINPSQADASGQQIAAFTLPEGWRSEYAIKAGNFRLVGYAPATGTGHIMLAQIPETERADVAKLEREMRSLAASHGYHWSQGEMTVVERRPITIRDQATELIISEGRGSSGAWRQAMAYFRGDRGLTLVIFGMPQDSYDEAAADAFFASIH
jgi:hypothetical protein